MSPEQAKGQVVNFQSDQFSFGAIVYEMVTGERAFGRGSAAETLSAILREEPKELVELSPKTPAHNKRPP
jgi:serine/threonine protein kinase